MIGASVKALASVTVWIRAHSVVVHEIKDFVDLTYSAQFLRRGKVMRLNLIYTLVITLCFGALIARADSLELKNGSLIKGKFVGGTDTEIKFQVGSSVQRYNIVDIVSLSFDSARPATDTSATKERATEASGFVTVPPSGLAPDLAR